MSEKMKAKIDEFLGRWTSRKLMVFIIATILTLVGDVTSSDWVTISAVYIGGQTVIDAISTLRK
tara:strand:- start:2888 stop:3079 length:192 start_codon:yes stop_codon:yes gene_type:complete